MNAYFVAGLVAIVVALIGGLATDVGPWYRALRKPRWNPPDWLFAPAWTVIYGLCVYAAGAAWNALEGPDRTYYVLLPFALNAVLNALWSVVFFSWKRPDWALIEVGGLWLSTAGLCWSLWDKVPSAAAALVIYVAWVTFAATLNVAIVRLNSPLPRPQ